MSLALLLAWWNLIYLLPFALAVAYLGVYVFTGMTFGDHDFDADLDGGVHAAEFDSGHVEVEAHVVGGEAGGDVDADADADHDIGGEVDHDADADADADAENSGGALARTVHVAPAGAHSGGGSPVMGLLSLLGVGKIPVSLVLMILLLLWGSTGFLVNQLILNATRSDWIIAMISLPVTAAISFTLTGLIARTVGKYLPSMETYVHRRTELVGQIGEAIYNVDGNFGMVSVRDVGGDLFQVPCRTAEGARVILKGTKVVLFDYDSEKGVFRVAPFPRENG